MLLKLPFDPLHKVSQPGPGKPTPCQAVRQSLWLSFVDLPQKCGTNVFVVLRFSPFLGATAAAADASQGLTRTTATMEPKAKQLRNIYLRCTTSLGSPVVG